MRIIPITVWTAIIAVTVSVGLLIRKSVSSPVIPEPDPVYIPPSNQPFRPANSTYVSPQEFSSFIDTNEDYRIKYFHTKNIELKNLNSETNEYLLDSGDVIQSSSKKEHQLLYLFKSEQRYKAYLSQIKFLSPIDTTITYNNETLKAMSVNNCFFIGQGFKKYYQANLLLVLSQRLAKKEQNNPSDKTSIVEDDELQPRKPNSQKEYQKNFEETKHCFASIGGSVYRGSDSKDYIQFADFNHSSVGFYGFYNGQRIYGTLRVDFDKFVIDDASFSGEVSLASDCKTITFKQFDKSISFFLSDEKRLF